MHQAVAVWNFIALRHCVEAIEQFEPARWRAIESRHHLHQFVANHVALAEVDSQTLGRQDHCLAQIVGQVSARARSMAPEGRPIPLVDIRRAILSLAVSLLSDSLRHSPSRLWQDRRLAPAVSTAPSMPTFPFGRCPWDRATLEC